MLRSFHRLAQLTGSAAANLCSCCSWCVPEPDNHVNTAVSVVTPGLPHCGDNGWSYLADMFRAIGVLLGSRTPMEIWAVRSDLLKR